MKKTAKILAFVFGVVCVFGVAGCAKRKRYTIFREISTDLFAHRPMEWECEYLMIAHIEFWKMSTIKIMSKSRSGMETSVVLREGRKITLRL